jgi:hypothetical protein
MFSGGSHAAFAECRGGQSNRKAGSAIDVVDDRHVHDAVLDRGEDGRAAQAGIEEGLKLIRIGRPAAEIFGSVSV